MTVRRGGKGKGRSGVSQNDTQRIRNTQVVERIKS